jgi:hypothetical protein
MGKNRLTSEDYFNFDLLGIVSTVKEYKLVWHINQVTGFELSKENDLSIEFSGNQRIHVSNFQHRSEFMHVQLLKNKLVAKSSTTFQYLIDELKQFDYLLKYKDETEQTTIKDVLSLLKKSEVVEYVAVLSPELIKSRDNLIF